MAETTDKAAATTRETAQSVTDEIREKGTEAAQAAKDAARTQAERARDEAYARGEEYRDYAADETAKVASALRQASKDLSEGSPQERVLGQIADGVADAADRMRGMTFSDTVRETDAFARRHPAAFLGGAALLGFAAARFLKASAHDEERLYLPPSNRTSPGAPAAATAAPGATTPGPATPGTSTPGTATPSGSTPGTSTPSGSTPGSSTPRTTPPGTSAPGATPKV